MVKNSQNTVNNPYDGMSNEKLKLDLVKLQEMGKREDAFKIMEELKKREHPNQSKAFEEKANNTYKDLLKRMNDKDPKKRPTKDEFKKFFQTDIKNYKAEGEKNLVESNAFKDKKIEDLQKQLNDTITQMPTLREYLSPARRRLITIHNTFAKMKKGTDNYPKNVLIYAMGITNHVVLGTRQVLKRNRYKLARRRKSEDIKEHLKTMEEKLNINNDDQQPRKRNIKLILKEQIHEAKIAYLDKQKESLGLAA